MNVTNEKGNAFNNKGITRWMFANGEINCIGGSSKDASAFVFNAETSKSFNLDMLRGIKITMENYAYGFYSSHKARYLGIENGATVECNAVTTMLRGYNTSNYFYPQDYIQMEYTKDGKTALANVKVRLGAVSFKGEHTSLDFFTYPTAENNAGITFISWVEE